MKKLILVTLTAFAASWLLAEARREPMPQPTITEPVRVAPAPRPAYTKETRRGHVSLVQTVPWNAANVFQSDPAPAPVAKRATKPAPPSWFPKPEFEEASRTYSPSEPGIEVIVGRVSASEDRARQDLRQTVEQAVTRWIAADVATSWKVPASVLRTMVLDSYTQEVTRNLITPEVEASKPEIPGVDGLYTLYRAGQKLDFSPSRKAEIIAMYRHDLATQRMQRLGGGLALTLVTLAVLSGYIKTDEATKGYYTNRLRFVAAAGLGAAGVVAYRLWV